MISEKDEVLQGLKTAMEAELAGNAFYSNAAAATSDTKGKETFSRLAKEEMGHFNYLRHQYRSVLKTGDYDFSEEFVRSGDAHSAGPVFSPELKDRVKDAHFEISALTIGMKLEMDAIRFYGSLAEKAENEKAKQFYKELVEWEKVHYDSFSQELEMLKEAYWQANQFVPLV